MPPEQVNQFLQTLIGAPKERRSADAKDKPHRCPECSCSYYSIYHLQRHQRAKNHGDPPPLKWSWNQNDGISRYMVDMMKTAPGH